MSEIEMRDVDVYCTHGGGWHKIATLVTERYAARPEWGWTLAAVGDAHGDFTALTAELIDDRALPHFATPELAEAMDHLGRHRERYQFRCECGDTLPARREGLEACAAKLAGHGASDVTMTALRRMLALI